VICILFIAFVSIFALDVFEENLGFWQTLAGLAVHLIPGFLLCAALAVAWRWEWIGAVVFIACAVFFALIVRAPWWGKAIFVAPCLLTAWLFLGNWQAKKAESDTAH